MKKFLFIFFAILSFSAFTCPLEEDTRNHYILIYTNDYNYSREQAERVVDNVNNIRIGMVTAGMDLEQVDTLSRRIMTMGDPLTTTSIEALLNGLTTAQQNATDQGFGSLNVDSVSVSGSGLNVSMSATNGNSTTTAQINTSSSVPTYSNTGATVTGSSSNAATVSNVLYNTNENNRPVSTSSSTVDQTTGKPIRIFGGARVESNGDGGSILLDGTIKGN